MDLGAHMGPPAVWLVLGDGEADTGSRLCTPGGFPESICTQTCPLTSKFIFLSVSFLQDSSFVGKREPLFTVAQGQGTVGLESPRTPTAVDPERSP